MAWCILAQLEYRNKTAHQASWLDSYNLEISITEAWQLNVVMQWRNNLTTLSDS